jgi:hypothetical protein
MAIETLAVKFAINDEIPDQERCLTFSASA